ncbi:MAG: DegT/DnrJ/EryC1/StrS family aminotransferase, partial [Opitutaceae bacterium]|nr:DegT/DnrJ/EryC1/StrS family aminotransferase [Opitutaceae bacterium]
MSAPLRPRPTPGLGAAVIGAEEEALVLDVLRRKEPFRYYGADFKRTPPMVAQLEKEFREYVGTDYALGVSSGTGALEVALAAMGIGPGDEVITTTHTFTATAEVVRYLGAEVVFADIDPRTGNLDPAAAAAVLAREPGIRAIVPVHFAGQACDLDAIGALAQRHGIPVVEDAAHALPTTWNGELVGRHGHATVFSFYATKTIATGEGGMIVSRDPALLARARTMRLHGINRDVFDRYRSTAPAWYYEVVAPGFKYNLPDTAAAMGIEQLRKAWRFQARRAAIAARYDAALAGLPVATPVVVRPAETHAWHLYVLQLDLDRLRVDRDRFIALMAEAGIGTSVHFIPLHRQPYWRDRYGFTPADFPVADAVYRRAVSLPI